MPAGSASDSKKPIGVAPLAARSEIHAQRLARDIIRPVVEKEMDAGNDAIGREHEVASRWRGQRCSVVDKPERAGRGSERPKITRDQAVFG